MQLQDAIVLCCRKKDARVWSISKLLEFNRQAVVYFGVVRVDKHGAKRRVNGILSEDDDLHDIEEDDDKRYHNENERTRDLFSSMPAPPAVRLTARVGAKVLCTQKLDKDVRVGCMGIIVGFSDVAKRMKDDMLSSYDMAFGMNEKLAQEDWVC